MVGIFTLSLSNLLPALNLIGQHFFVRELQEYGPWHVPSLSQPPLDTAPSSQSPVV